MSILAGARGVHLLLILLLPCLVQTAMATGSDVAKERRWAEQVVDGLLDGDDIWLSDGDGHDFLGIFTEADSGSASAVILIHGIGIHPNWPDVIYPLREALLKHGITTLSVQMPILENNAASREYALLFPEVPHRLDAATSYLSDAGYRRISIIGHSMGATMAAYYLSRDKENKISSFVAIGMGPGISDSAIDNVIALENIRVPVMDLYGSEDLEQVLNTAELRADAANKRPGLDYQQVKVEGANHFFQGSESAMIRPVIEWLDQQSN